MSEIAIKTLKVSKNDTFTSLKIGNNEICLKKEELNLLISYLLCGSFKGMVVNGIMQGVVMETDFKHESK